MRFSLLFFFLLLGVLYHSLAQGTFEDCCLSYVKKIKPQFKRRVTSYRTQAQDGGCNLPAIVFRLRRGSEFCTRPGVKWVQDLMKQIDKINQQKKTEQTIRKQGKNWQ